MRPIPPARPGLPTPARVALAAALVLAVLPSIAPAQEPPRPGIRLPIPLESELTIATDSFTAPDGQRRAFTVTRSRTAAGPRPGVVFVNGSGPALMRMQGYVDWSRLVTTRGLAGILYEGPSFDPARTPGENLRTSMAYLDSLHAHLERDRHGEALGVYAHSLVFWAGSAQTFTGTPFALGGERAYVRGYVLYYGAGVVAEPRTDVPVFMVRAGLDAAPLNAALDSLARQLVDAGAPVTLVSHPTGPHGFDVLADDALTTHIIYQTLDFIEGATLPGLQTALEYGAPLARAASAMARGRVAEAEGLYTALARERAGDRFIAWHLGLAQLANGHPAEALASFDRAKALGQGGARDIGLPAMRAAIRARNPEKAVEWTRWALRSFPRIRAEIAADAELAPLLEHPEVRGR